MQTKANGAIKQTTQEHIVHKGVFTSKNTGMKIDIKGGRTLNLGNYESVKSEVGVTIPCDPDQMNEAYEFATDWVTEKLAEAVKMAKGV